MYAFTVASPQMITKRFNWKYEFSSSNIIQGDILGDDGSGSRESAEATK